MMDELLADLPSLWSGVRGGPIEWIACRLRNYMCNYTETLSIQLVDGGVTVLICHDIYSEHEYDEWCDIVPSSIQTTLG